jgi:hypothetical protein
MAEYLYAIGGYTPTAWELKGLAVACITFIILRKCPLHLRLREGY